MFTCQKCLSNQGYLIDFPDQTIKIEQWPVRVLVCTNEDKSRNQYTYLHFLPGWLFFFLNTYSHTNEKYYYKYGVNFKFAA